MDVGHCHTWQEMTLESRRKVTISPQAYPDELKLRQEIDNKSHRPLFSRILPARSGDHMMDVPPSFEAKGSHQSANQKMALKPVYVPEYLVLSSRCCLEPNRKIEHELAEGMIKLQTRTVMPVICERSRK